MSIPKIIHYCWFGNKELPDEFKKYIDTWKKYLPEYKIMCWNENTINLNEVDYVREAYENKKYAFVSDYARIRALYEYGGIYFDTDVEVKKPFEHLFKDFGAVLCTEGVKANTIMTGFMAFEKNHPLCKKILDYYKVTHFCLPDGSLNTYSNTLLLAKILKQNYDILPSEETQIKEDIVVYPSDYFTAFDGTTQKPRITENTVCVHHFARSWFTPWELFKENLRGIKKKIIK